MHALVALLFFFAQPFWGTKTPDQWSLKEIETLRTNSPWAQTVGPSPAILMYLATAAPIQEAESELRLRSRNPIREPDPDYEAYLMEHRDRHIVLAVAYTKLLLLGKASEQRKLEEESAMRVGSRTYKIDGQFPPTPSYPVLRLIFPREVRPGDKTVVFRLYLPGVDFPEREVEFPVKELIYRGKLEM
jgi:hypothetical protein